MIAATIVSACDYVWIGNKRLGGVENDAGVPPPPFAPPSASFLGGIYDRLQFPQGIGSV